MNGRLETRATSGERQLEEGGVVGGGGTGGGVGGSGQHLGSRYVFSHVKEVVVAAHVLGEERDPEQFWRMPVKLSDMLIITRIHL